MSTFLACVAASTLSTKLESCLALDSMAVTPPSWLNGSGVPGATP
jgi:hypothetical protein